MFNRKMLEMLTIFKIKKCTLPHLFTLSIDAAVQRYLPHVYIYSPAKIDPDNNKIFTSRKMFTLPWTLTVSMSMVVQFTLTRKNQTRFPTLTPSSSWVLAQVLLVTINNAKNYVLSILFTKFSLPSIIDHRKMAWASELVLLNRINEDKLCI